MTRCDGLGCECSDPLAEDTVTILISDNNNLELLGDTRHCLCGDLQVRLYITRIVTYYACLSSHGLWG